MRVPRFLLSSAAIACCLSLPAFAEPTNAELDQRLRAVEGNIQTILELLKAQQAGASADAASVSDDVSTASGSTAAGYRWGALYFEVFSVPMDKEQEGSTNRPKIDLPDAPSEIPLASSLIPPSDKFEYGFTLENPETSAYAMSEGNLQVQWSGVLEARASGDHAFLLQLTGNEDAYHGASACRSVLRLNGQTIVEANHRGSSVDKFNINGQGKVALDPGVYDFSLFLTCIGRREVALRSVAVELRMAEPGDRAPKPILPERLGVRL